MKINSLPKIENFDKAINKLNDTNIGYKIIIHLDDVDYFRNKFLIYDDIEVKTAKILLSGGDLYTIGKYLNMDIYTGNVLSPGEFLLVTKNK